MSRKITQYSFLNLGMNLKTNLSVISQILFESTFIYEYVKQIIVAFSSRIPTDSNFDIDNNPFRHSYFERVCNCDCGLFY